MKSRGQIWLIVGAVVSLAVAILHIVIVFIGPSAYNFFGGTRLARLAAGGSSSPATMTLTLAAVHFVFGIYGLSGAGILRRLPFLAIGLFIIGGLYTFRGLSVINQTIQILTDPGSLPVRVVLYSVVFFVTGCAYIVGTVQSWGWLQEKKERGSDTFSA